jgi:hypothetical protein
MFNSDKKKDALHKLEMAQKDYESAGKRASESVTELYLVRKQAVKRIEQAENFLRKQTDFGVDNIEKVANARASIRKFTEAVQNETNITNSITDSTSKYAGVAVAGTVTGAAVAALGPTAAMAIATTFGTAATGTAISTLSGVAATNAALAWLGGGAIAVGGGGMAAGNAILALTGPIGWAIGGVAVGVTVFSVSKKNKKIAEEANKMISDINSALLRLNSSTDDMNKLTVEIRQQIKSIEYLQTKISNMDERKEVDYNEIVGHIVELCKKINKKFTI